MSEVIQLIEEYAEKEGYYSYSGFLIRTDKQEIKLLIDNDQYCCEHHGYFMSEDDLQPFVGSQLLELSVTDTALKTHLMKERGLDETSPYVYEGGVMFVNISTSNGLLQFVAYNEHNGYYGHEAKVISNQLNHNITL